VIRCVRCYLDPAQRLGHTIQQPAWGTDTNENGDRVIGQTLGTYKLVQELGRGGFATVYRALQAALNRDVAIKVLHPEFIRDERALRRFKREAVAVARLTHPNIVAVYDYGEQDGHAYLVMEYISGATLKARLGGKPLPNMETLAVVKAVGSALDYAHSKGLVHRDVKPGNILYTEDNRIVLSDFGIVRLADDDSSLTRGVIGTPQYMSPEQALGHEVDGRSDLYSLGIVLFEMLAGRVPYKGESAVATLSMHATLPVPSTRKYNEQVPDVIDRIVQRALAKSPDERFQTGQELINSLSGAIENIDRIPTGSSTILAPSLIPEMAPSLSIDLSPRDLEEMYRQLLDLTRARDWRAVVTLAAQILAKDPNFRDVSAILSSASNELRFGRTDSSVEVQVKGLVSQAETSVASGRLMEAVAILQQALRMDPDDAAARTSLETTKAKLAEQETVRRLNRRLENLYTLAQSKIKAADYRWAHHILTEILEADANYRDAASLMEDVNAKLDTRPKYSTPAAQMSALRQEAEAAMAGEHWQEAVSLWEQILELEPNVAGVSDKVELSRQRARIAALNAEVARLAAEGRFEDAIQKLEEIKKLSVS
jgi:serine/threonine protein kinase